MRQDSIKAAMAVGDFYGKLADEASARGEHYRSIDLNKLSMAAYTRAETLSMLEDGDEN